MTATVKFTCHDCGTQVVVDIGVIRLDLDPTDSSVVIVLETCCKGHTTNQRLHLTDHAHLVDALITAGAHMPGISGVEAYLAELPDITAWLDSPAFDAERAALRLTGGLA